MTGIIPLLTSFHGRISRKSFWLGMAILVAASFAGTYVFNPDAFSLDLNSVPELVWADTIWQLVLLIPGTALMVKRFNDRNWPYWLGYAFGAMGAFLLLAPYFGLVIDPDSSGAARILFWITAAAYLFAFVDNGFLPGTKGPNRYGPDSVAVHEKQVQ